MSEVSGAKLPRGWACGRLGDAVAVVRGVTYRKQDSRKIAGDGLVPVLRANNIQHSLVFEDLVYVPATDISEAQMLKPGDIVVAASSGSRAIVGKAAQLRHAWDGAFGAFCFALRPGRLLEPRFIGWFLHTREYRSRVSEASAGVNINNLRPEHIEETPVRFPPILEQGRIADALDELLSDLDAGVAALERARDKLKLYRAAVLKAAVEGALTAEWRREHPHTEAASELLKRILVERRRRWEAEQLRKFKEKGREPPKGWKAKYKEPAAPDTADLAPLPAGWCWAVVEQIGEVTTGFTPPTSNEGSFGGGIPFFKPTDLDQGYYVRAYRQSLSEEGAALGRLLPPRSVMVTCIGATIGKVGLARVPCATNQQINSLSVNHELILPEHLYWSFSSPFGQRQIVTNASATTLPILNKSRFKALAVAVPPYGEQQAIVESVEDQLSIIDHLESHLAAKLSSAKTLRQAILRDAFAGKLVPQDPNDEPASELLKRIAAERAQRARETAGAKKQNGRKPRGGKRRGKVAECATNEGRDGRIANR